MQYKAVYQYLSNLNSGNDLLYENNLRIVTKDERSGVNTTSIHSMIEIEDHTLNNTKGSLTLWFMSLEDLSHMAHYPNFLQNNPFYKNYTFISDRKELQDFEKCSFSINWNNTWYPQLYAKFFKGNIYPDAYHPKEKAIVSVEHLEIHKDIWYQLCLTWDKPDNSYKLYINGILIGISNQLTDGLYFDEVGETLYVGNPCLCLSEIKFYSQCLISNDVNTLYQIETFSHDERYLKSLREIYVGENIEKFNWEVSELWKLQLDLTLTEDKHLYDFYVQGCVNAPSITKEGLLVETPNKMPRHNSGSGPDLEQVYLWTNKNFEGDLYIEYEFMVLKEGGYSMLIFQASGMQREDFMKDYPLRTNGSMKMVFGEDVRSYYWGYYREMNDVRNDVATHFIVKNPWLRPLGYRCMDSSLDKCRWHKLQLLQEGEHIRCAIDDKVVLDVQDNAFNNNGPVLNFGRIAIRCMVRTKILFKNFRIYNK